MAIQQSTYAVPRADLAEAFWEYDERETQFIASLVLPRLDVAEKAATMSVITRESMLKMENADRGPGGSYNRVDTYAEDKAYSCEEYGLEAPLEDGKRRLYQSDFDAEEVTVRQAWLKLLLAWEQRVDTLVFATGTWTGAALYTDVSAAPWDAAASDAIAHVIAAREKVRTNTGLKPNALILGAATLANLLGNTGIKNRFPGATLVTLAMLEQAMGPIFGLERLIVGEAVYDSAKEGQDFSGADVWADDYAMVARVAKPGDPMNTPCIGRSMLWVTDSPEEIVVEEYREEQTRSDIFRVRHHMVSQIFDAYFGHLLKVDA